MSNTAAAMRERFLQQREGTSDAWRTRIHRAISWLKRSEQEHDDPDARFIFLWIAFNAAYASDEVENSEYQRYSRFARCIAALDGESRLHNVLFARFSGAVRVLLENQYVFEPFWRAQRAATADDKWLSEFQIAKQRAYEAVLKKETGIALAIVLDRLYVLRNQLVHGGATWRSQANRQQLRDGVALLGDLVSAVITIMLDHPHHDFGEVVYPSLQRPAKVSS